MLIWWVFKTADFRPFEQIIPQKTIAVSPSEQSVTGACPLSHLFKCLIIDSYHVLRVVYLDLAKFAQC